MNRNTKKSTADTVDASMPSDQFHLAKSTLHNFSTQQAQLSSQSSKLLMDTTLRNTLMKDYQFFEGCAQEYKLSGLNFYDLFDHNANVAKKYGNSNVYTLWIYVKNCFALLPNDYKEHVNQQNIQNRLSAQNSNQSSGGQSFAGAFSGATLTGKITEKDEKTLLNDNNISSSNDDLHDNPENSLNADQTNSSTTPSLIIDSTELTSDNIDFVKNFRNGFLYTGE